MKNKTYKQQQLRWVGEGGTVQGFPPLRFHSRILPITDKSQGRSNHPERFEGSEDEKCSRRPPLPSDFYPVDSTWTGESQDTVQYGGSSPTVGELSTPVARVRKHALEARRQ